MSYDQESSNYLVLKDILKRLSGPAENESVDAIVNDLREFLNGKKSIETELDRLRIKATRGDNTAAQQLMAKLAEMNDGP